MPRQSSTLPTMQLGKKSILKGDLAIFSTLRNALFVHSVVIQGFRQVLNAADFIKLVNQVMIHCAAQCWIQPFGLVIGRALECDKVENRVDLGVDRMVGPEGLSVWLRLHIMHLCIALIGIGVNGGCLGR